MVKLDIITGFLGAGKTTFINKLLREGYAAEKPILIENEFGDVSIDDEILSPDIQVKLLSSGCICCSMKGDFIKGVTEIIETYNPSRILVEPTGLADLGDILSSCAEAAKVVDLQVNSVITVINVKSFLPLLMVGGEFFQKQATQARFAVMSCTQLYTQEEVEETLAEFRQLNPGCPIITEDWANLDALSVLTLAEEAYASQQEGQPESEAESVSAGNYTSMAVFPLRRFSDEAIAQLLDRLTQEKYGQIFRAKGFLKNPDGSPRLVEYVYGRGSCKPCDYAGTAKLVVIGKNLNKRLINRLFMEV